MAARPRGAHPLNGVPTLLIVDDRAAVLAGAPAAPAPVGTALEPTDLPIAAVPMHGAHLREGAGTLAAPTDRLLARRRAILRRVSPRRAGRSMVATDARTMIDYQHRSPSR
jgi:hypothetical protein